MKLELSPKEALEVYMGYIVRSRGSGIVGRKYDIDPVLDAKMKAFGLKAAESI